MKYYFVSFSIKGNSDSDGFCACDSQFFLVDKIQRYLEKKYGIKGVTITSYKEISKEEYEANM